MDSQKAMDALLNEMKCTVDTSKTDTIMGKENYAAALMAKSNSFTKATSATDSTI